MQQIDYILQSNSTIVAIEIKSGYNRGSLPGMEEFDRNFKPKRKLLVGGVGISLEKFFSYPAENWMS